MKKSISVESLIESLDISRERFEQWVKTNIHENEAETEHAEPDILFFDLHSPAIQRNKSLMTGTGY
ncbi:hypothetical protein [Gorillibacterium massiliense]|uniref:hypothetical protein n=1 Tax=Gorillibacterium massiliense TaxID=1280390 RepID=UPI0004B71581|nr:hypothetical protein [Gorillibacterium massiliense]